jgi:chromosome segregation ATPase
VNDHSVNEHLESDAAVDELLSERVETLAAWIQDLEAQLRATSVAGDGKQLKELAKALEAWNKHDPKLQERVTNRVDVLADRFETLARTVNTTAAALAGKDGEIARLRRELEEGTARMETVVRELRQTGGAGGDVAELRKAIAALSSEKRSKGGDKRVDALSAELDVLAQRLDTLSKTVSTTAAGLAGREGELAAVRARLEQGDARADSVIRELRASLDALARQVGELGDRPRDSRATELFGALLDELHGKVEQLASKLDAVSGSVAKASAGLAANEAELATFHRRFEEAGAQVDGMIQELRETVAALPTAGSVEAAIEDDLRTLGVQVDGAMEHVSRLEAATKARLAHASAATADLERVLAEVSERLVGLERERDTVADALGRAADAWNEERLWVRGQLQALAAAVEDAQSDDSLKPELDELSARVEAIEHEHETVGAELARMAAALDAERDELKGELDALATSLGTPAGPSAQDVNEHSERAVAELARRLDDMERQSTAVSVEIARAQAFWAAEIASLESRLGEIARGPVHDVEQPGHEAGDRIDELTRRLDALERERGQAAVAPSEEVEELRDLRVLINGLRMRLASSEKELAALTSSGDVSARLDDLSLRLASVERSSIAAVAAVAPHSPGDGRFRVEIRALEQRMQQLDEAARENRDAVLMQFERLASRLQWRLQQLEMESADAAYGPPKPTPAPRPLGQVVPIRGEG